MMSLHAPRTQQKQEFTKKGRTIANHKQNDVGHWRKKLLMTTRMIMMKEKDILRHPTNH